jgi:hypothetical protein
MQAEVQEFCLDCSAPKDHLVAGSLRSRIILVTLRVIVALEGISDTTVLINTCIALSYLIFRNQPTRAELFLGLIATRLVSLFLPVTFL